MITRNQAEAIGWAVTAAASTGKPIMVLQNILYGHYEPVMAEDDFSDEWLEKHNEIAFVYPPYGKGKRLLPLFQLKQAHFLIGVLAKNRGFCQDSLFFDKSIDILFYKIKSQKGLIFFNNEIWQEFFKNNTYGFAGNNPCPGNSLVVLSRLLARNCSDLEYIKQEFYRRLISHLHRKVKVVNDRLLTRLAGSPRLALMDAYTSLTINYSSTPSYTIFHSFIIPVIGELVKDLMKAPSGRPCKIDMSMRPVKTTYCEL